MSDAWEWSDHIPSGFDDMSGYGHVSCSCGWDSSDEKLGWVEHIEAMLPDRSAERSAEDGPAETDQ